MIMLNHPRRAEDVALHTDENPHCGDFTCPCWNTLAEPGMRSDFDILSQFTEDDSEVSSGMGDGYLSFYDSRVPVDMPPLTCSGLYEFMLSTINPEQSDRWNKGWIAGMLMAMGESDPNFSWESAPAPLRPHTDEMPFCGDLKCECHFDVERISRHYIQPQQDGLLTDREAIRLFMGEQL